MFEGLTKQFVVILNTSLELTAVNKIKFPVENPI